VASGSNRSVLSYRRFSSYYDYTRPAASKKSNA